MNPLNWLLLHQPSIIGNISNLTVFGLLGAVIRAYFKVKCQSCRRIALHKVGGTTYRTCTRHTTIAHHAELHQQHAIDHPEQHELLNKE